MGLETCRNCGNDRLLRSRSPTVHLLRVAVGSTKRFCPECGRRWSQFSAFRYALKALAVASVVATFVYSGYRGRVLARSAGPSLSDPALARRMSSPLRSRAAPRSAWVPSDAGLETRTESSPGAYAGPGRTQPPAARTRDPEPIPAARDERENIEAFINQNGQMLRDKQAAISALKAFKGVPETGSDSGP